MRSVTISPRSISLSRLLETAVVGRRPSSLQHRNFCKCKEDDGNLVPCKLARYITKSKLLPEQDNVPLKILGPHLKLTRCKNLFDSQVTTRKFSTSRSVVNRSQTARSFSDMLGCSTSISSLETNVPFRLAASTYSTKSLADVSSHHACEVDESGGSLSVSREFKQPKSTLHNFYDILAAKLKNNHYRVTHNFKLVKAFDNSSKALWSCTYCVKWPLEKCFTAEGINKADASTHAALYALTWLKKANVIDKKGRPLLSSTVEVTNAERKVEALKKIEKVNGVGEKNTPIIHSDNVKSVDNQSVTVVNIPENMRVLLSDTRNITNSNGITNETPQNKTKVTESSVKNNPEDCKTKIAQCETTEAQEEGEITMIDVDNRDNHKKTEKLTRLKAAVLRRTASKIACSKPGTTQQDTDIKTISGDTETTAGCSNDVLKGMDVAILAIKQPKSALHNLYVNVANELNNQDYKLQQSFHLLTRPKHKGAQMRWTCTYVVKWPTEARFVGEGDNKSSAAKHAALQVLNWLRKQGKITKNGAPILHKIEEVKELKKSLFECSIDDESVTAIKGLLDSYREDVQYILQQYGNDERSVDDDYLPDVLNLDSPKDIITSSTKDPITGRDITRKSSTAVERRNEELYQRMLRWDEDPTAAMLNVEMERSRLPIFKFRMDVCQMVAENRVVIVKGEPGCGKSTQVPQFLLEYWSARRRGSECNIIVTQPRRISAISLAKYVANQRQEKLGDVVGYQVRLNSVLPRPPGGAVLFCSTGILLQRLRDNPGLCGLSHVILDEAHERDLNTDILLVLLRRAVLLNPDLHVVVMSATINTELLQMYFGQACALHVPGFTYPVKQHFFDDLTIPNLKIKTESFNRPNPIIDSDEVAKVINWVDKNRPLGAILCFLPGWAEIKAVMKSLQKLNGGFGYILPLHSRLSDDDQKRIFSTPPPGLRKIILSTNIAETSLTINDVVYVIDCGAHKEERLSINKEISSLDNQWVSQANVDQRKGRAGRVQPGESYHLFPRSLYRSLDVYPIPEVLRVPLEKTIVDIKAYSKDDKVEKFLLEMPEPPTSGAVHLAVSELIQLGVLDTEENLTSLGERILSFTTHPKLSKILIYAAIFRCLAPALTIATLLSNDVELFHSGLEAKEAIRKCKSKYHSSSDHLALAWLYQEWEKLVEESMMEPINFCYDRNLNSESLALAQKLRKLVGEHLLEAKMVRDVDTCMDLDAPCNQYARSDELVKAVLLSGFNTLLQRRNWDISRGRLKKNKNVLMTESGLRATVTTESVNTKRTEFSTPFLTYFRQVLSTERRATIIRETSLVSPFGILLFKPGELHVHEQQTANKKGEGERVVLSLKGKRTVAVVCKESDAKLLEELRIVISKVTDYLMQKEGLVDHDYDYRTILIFHDKLLHVLSRFLQTAAQSTDSDVAQKVQNAD